MDDMVESLLSHCSQGSRVGGEGGGHLSLGSGSFHSSGKDCFSFVRVPSRSTAL